MSDIPLGLALFDFVPVILFLLSGIVLWKIFSRDKCMLVTVLALFAVGFCKALHKLLSVYDISNPALDFVRDSHMCLQALCFLTLGFLVLTAVSRNDSAPLGNANPNVLFAVFSVLALADLSVLVDVRFKIISHLVILIGALVLWGMLIWIGRRNDDRLATLCFSFSLLFVLAMAFLSTSSLQDVSMQWTEETVNSISEALLLAGMLILYRKGVKYPSL